MRSFKLLVPTCVAAVTMLAGTSLASPPLVPEAMLRACAERAAGAACSVSFGGKAKQGVCTALPDKTLACMPPRAAGTKKRGSATPAK